eukprot:10184850-Lingulodinium_polyedra.AAC.1
MAILPRQNAHDCTNVHATCGPCLRTSHAKWPGALARASPAKGVRHRRTEPGNTRLSQDYGSMATKLPQIRS